MTTAYLGKLDPETTKEEIKQFMEAAGKVEKVYLRRVRHFRRDPEPKKVLYAFVRYETPEQMNAAVDQLNGKELKGAQVVVEVARPKKVREPKPKAATDAAGADAAKAGNGEGAAAAGKRRRRRRRGAKKEGEAPKEGEERKEGEDGKEKSERPRRRPRRPRIETPISTNVAYVGNLPFVVDEEGMKEIFEGCSFIETRVIRFRSGRSRGFGFVTFKNEEDRAEAIKVTDGSVVEGRRITVKPARERPPRRDASDSPASTGAADTPATPGETPAAPAPDTPAAPAQ